MVGLRGSMGLLRLSVCKVDKACALNDSIGLGIEWVRRLSR